MTRTRRSAWNYLGGVTFTAVSLIAGLVSTPLLLRWLGDERLGAYRAATDCFGYLSLLEFGLGGSLLPPLALAVARRSKADVTAALAAGIQAYLGVALLMLVAGASLLRIIPYLVPVSTAVASDLLAGCLVSLLGCLLMPFSPFRALAEANQRSYVVNGLLIFQTLLVIAFALVLAWNGWGIMGQSVALLVGAIPFHLVLAWDGIRRYPDTLISLTGGRRLAGMRQQLWKLNRSALTFDMCGRVSLLTDNIIIAYLLGPAIVVPFFITQRLAVLAQGQLQGIGNASWAALVELHVRGDHKTFNQRLVDLTGAAATLGVAAMMPIAAYNQHFVNLWVGSGSFGGELATMVAIVNGFLQGIFSLWGWVFTGTGQVARLVRMYVTSAIINLTMSIVCTQLFGLVGPLFGTLAAFLTVNLWWLPWLLRRDFGTPLRPLFGAVAFPLAIGLPYAAVVWWFAHVHVPWGWLGLAWEMSIVALSYLALWWWFVLTRDERSLWIGRICIGFGW